MATHLTLFVADTTPGTQRMAAALRRWCDTHLEGAYRLDILDTRLCPDERRQYDVLAVPSLVLEGSPARLVGDFSEPDGWLHVFLERHTS